MNRFLKMVSGVGALILVASLASSPLSAAGSDQEAISTPDNTSQSLTQDTDHDVMRIISTKSSSFAGLYRDRDTGKLVINLTDVSQKDVALQAAANVLGADRISKEGVEVRQVKYSMAQLKTWKDAVSQVMFDTEGVVAVGVDQVRNRVFVGVNDDKAKSVIRSKLTELNLPEDAFSIALMQFKDAVGLQDNVRPLIGGIGIATKNSGDCTMAFVADRQGVRGFVTASHCTDTPATYDSGKFYQPYTISTSTEVGTEEIDPGTNSQTPSCPSGWKCRVGDVAFVKLKSGVTSSLGKIAKTDSNLNIAGNYNVIGTRIAISGEDVSVIGSKTGYHSGYIFDTCLTFSGQYKSVNVQMALESKVVV